MVRQPLFDNRLPVASLADFRYHAASPVNRTMPRFSILPPRFSACRSGRLLALAACLAAAQAQAGIEYSVDIDAPSDLAQLLRDNLSWWRARRTRTWTRAGWTRW